MGRPNTYIVQHIYRTMYTLNMFKHFRSVNWLWIRLRAVTFQICYFCGPISCQMMMTNCFVYLSLVAARFFFFARLWEIFLFLFLRRKLFVFFFCLQLTTANLPWTNKMDLFFCAVLICFFAGRQSFYFVILADSLFLLYVWFMLPH